jgi:hypothetical protein
MAMIVATIPSMRSVDLSLAGFRLPAGSWATATLAAIQRVTGLAPWASLHETIPAMIAPVSTTLGAAEAERPNHEPDEEKPEYRSEPQTTNQRHDDARGDKESHYLAKIEGFRVHGVAFSDITCLARLTPIVSARPQPRQLVRRASAGGWKCIILLPLPGAVCRPVSR